jgi:hypothetical protein
VASRIAFSPSQLFVQGVVEKILHQEPDQRLIGGCRVLSGSSRLCLFKGDRDLSSLCRGSILKIRLDGVIIETLPLISILLLFLHGWKVFDRMEIFTGILISTTVGRRLILERKSKSTIGKSRSIPLIASLPLILGRARLGSLGSLFDLDKSTMRMQAKLLTVCPTACDCAEDLIRGWIFILEGELVNHGIQCHSTGSGDGLSVKSGMSERCPVLSLLLNEAARFNGLVEGYAGLVHHGAQEHVVAFKREGFRRMTHHPTRDGWSNASHQISGSSASNGIHTDVGSSVADLVATCLEKPTESIGGERMTIIETRSLGLAAKEQEFCLGLFLDLDEALVPRQKLIKSLDALKQATTESHDQQTMGWGEDEVLG